MSRRPGLSAGRSLHIDADEIRISYIHASGPGGQNVNKVASAAQLRFNVNASPSLDNETRKRLTEIAGRRMSRDGDLIITARRYRSQAQNRHDALRRLKNLIERASRRPKKRVPTRPSGAVKRRRLDAKAKRGQLKSSRRKPGLQD